MKNTIKTRFHRAFTIVELVIVIAVIAILAAVLIPTFANVIDAANESNDMVLVRNLNLSLSAADTPDKATVENKDSENVSVYNVTTAITSIRADGYDVSKLTPTADGGDIVYNASTNKFIYYAEDFTDLAYGDEPSENDVLVVMDTDLTRVGIAETVLTDNTIQYCVYSENGVDISTDEEINIWLYTERGTTTVSAAKATIDYFGTAEVIDIAEVKDDSFHVYGTIESLSVTKGHVELKSTSKTSSLKITSSDVKLTIVKGAEYEEVDAVNGVSYNLYTKESDDAEESTKSDNVETTLAEMMGEGSTFVSTLTLSADTTMDSALTVSAGLNKVIDLNGYTLTISGYTNSSHIINNGTLTITDSSTAKNGTLVVNTATYGITNNGTLTVEGGTITGQKVIYLNSTSASLYMTGGTLSTDVNSGYGVKSDSSLNTIITGGTISATGGGTSYAIYVKSCSGTTAISNVTISCSTYATGIYLQAGSSDVTIEGVTVKDNADTGFEVWALSSTVYIKDCQVTADNETTLFSSCALSLVGNVVIDGGTYRGDEVLCVQYGNPTIKSGTFIGKISVDDSLTITGGTYYSADPSSYVDDKNYDVDNSSGTYFTVKAKS